MESVLTITHFGYNPRLFRKRKIDNKVSYINNPDFGLRFFPKQLLRKSETLTFPVKKSKGTYRVFVLGASAAQGDPESSFGFSRILDCMLHKSYPDLSFEIINTSITAINSHVVLPIAKECKKYQPDIFILFLGNNEVVGPYGVGSMLSPFTANTTLIRLGLALRSTRIGQLLFQVRQRLFGHRKIPKNWGGMEMFLGHRVRFDDPRLEGVYRNFDRNLKDMCKVARQSGASVILCTVPTNIKDSPPFASLHRENLTQAEQATWNSLYNKGTALEAENNYKDALTYYVRAAVIDSVYADLQFRIGRCYGNLEQFSLAKKHFSQAQELDALRFRADKRINTIIEECHREKSKDTFLADVNASFVSYSFDSIPGDSLFYEHVHMNFTGNYLAAQTVFFKVQKALSKKFNRKKHMAPPSQARCKQHLAFTEWDKCQITSILKDRLEKPPFSQQIYHTEKMQTLLAQQDLCHKNIPIQLDSIETTYASAIKDREADWLLRYKYASFLQTRQKLSIAQSHYKKVMQAVPHYPKVYSSMGLLFSQQGRLTEAEAFYEKAISLDPRDPLTYNNFGLNQLRNGKLEHAETCFKKAIQLNPNYVSAYQNLGTLLKERNQLDEAIKQFDRALAVDPFHITTLLNKGFTLLKQKNISLAKKQFQKAIQIDSASIPAYMILGKIERSQSNAPEAILLFKKVLELNPQHRGAQVALAETEKK